MFNKILILVTLCVYCYGNEPIFRNDYKYYDEANGWFKLHLTPMKWQGARFMCYYEGAILVSPLNDQLRNNIVKFLNDQGSNATVIYSGVSATLASGVFQSIEGVFLEDLLIHWSKNEPARADGCLVFYSNNGTVGSKYCLDRYPFVCYKEKHNVEAVRNECGTIDNGYRRVAGSSKCYKYHSDGIDWDEAYKICSAEGGRLAIDYDVQLSEFTTQEAKAVYIGYELNEGVWCDIEGNPMVPRRTGQAGGCGARTWDGKFENHFCSEYHPFLCEKTPDQIV